MLLPLTWQVLAIGVAALLAITIVTRDARQAVKVVGATMWAWLYPLVSIIYDTFMIPWGLGGMPTLSLVVEVVSLYIVIGGMPALIVLLDGNKTTARRLIIGGDRVANGYCVARLASCLAIALGVQGMANLGLTLPDWLAAVIAIVVIVLFYIRCMPKISAIVSKTVVSDTDEADAANDVLLAIADNMDQIAHLIFQKCVTPFLLLTCSGGYFYIVVTLAWLIGVWPNGIGQIRIAMAGIFLAVSLIMSKKYTYEMVRDSE